MRRQLLKQGLLPLLAHYYGILAPDLHRYSIEELNAYIAALPKQGR